MSVAAGGRIRQRIKPDPVPAAKWDTDKTICLNVSMINEGILQHIIDSDAGLTAADYDGHYYALGDEDTPSNISGDFKGVMSVADTDETKVDDRFAQAASKIARRQTSHPVVPVSTYKNR